jgi:acyl carrier protein
VPLPGYPFERKRFWIEPARQVSETSTLADIVEPAHQEPCISSPGEQDGGAPSIGTSPRPDLKTAYVAPQSHIEKTLAKLWQEVLGLNEVGIHDNFFELGGQSLMAVTLVTEIGRVLGGRFSLASLIAAPTIHQFSEIVGMQQPPLGKSASGANPAMVEQQVRSFIEETYLFGQENGLKNSDSLLKHRIIDQMAFLQIAAFLDETYGISVKDEELTRNNMDSIDNVSAYVRRKLKGISEGAMSVSTNSFPSAQHEVESDSLENRAPCVSATLLDSRQSAI